MKAGDIIKVMVAAAIAATLLSCKDSFYELGSLSDFSVSTEKSVYKVGERVEFNLRSDADFIVFYSGEEGSEYEYKDKDHLWPDHMLLGFSTATYPDNGTNPESGRLLWSNDFPEVYEPEWIKLSTWHDITDRIVYPKPSPTNYLLYETPAVEISDLFAEDPGSPIYFCWAFKTEANTIRNRFRIDNWHIYGKNTGREFYSFAQSAFVMVEGQGFDIESSEQYYPRVTDKYIVWDGVSKSTVFKDGWAVSGPIYWSENINTGKDSGVTIKTIGDPVKRQHNYYYDKPGTYEVVFEAINANASKRTSAIAKTMVTIEGEESGQSNVPVIEVSTAEVEIPLSAMSATFNLRCSAGWTITSSDSLVSVDPVAGNAGDLYMVKVSVADGASSESMLQIKAGDAYKNVKVVLKQ